MRKQKRTFFAAFSVVLFALFVFLFKKHGQCQRENHDQKSDDIERRGFFVQKQHARDERNDHSAEHHKKRINGNVAECEGFYTDRAA